MRVALWLAWLGMLALVGLAYLWVPPAQAFKEPETARIIVFHVPAAFISVGCFLLGGFFGWRYLRRRDPLDDARSCACNEVGLLFGVLTTVTGMVFAQQQWGKAWHWDPRQTTIVIQLLTLRPPILPCGLRLKMSRSARCGARATPCSRR